jgi:hypothetical protein
LPEQPWPSAAPGTPTQPSPRPRSPCRRANFPSHVIATRNGDPIRGSPFLFRHKKPRRCQPGRSGGRPAARLPPPARAGIAERVSHERLRRRVLRDVTLQAVRPVRMRYECRPLHPLEMAAQAQTLEARDAVGDLGWRPIIHAGQPLGTPRRGIFCTLHSWGPGTGGQGPEGRTRNRTGHEQSEDPSSHMCSCLHAHRPPPRPSRPGQRTSCSPAAWRWDRTNPG